MRGVFCQEGIVTCITDTDAIAFHLILPLVFQMFFKDVFYHFAEGSRDFDFHLDVSASLVLWLGKVFVVYFPLLLANLFL